MLSERDPGRRLGLAHALRPGDLDAARPLRGRRPHDRRGARARPRPAPRAAHRRLRRALQGARAACRACSPTCTTRSSPTGWPWTASALSRAAGRPRPRQRAAARGGRRHARRRRARTTRWPTAGGGARPSCSASTGSPCPTSTPRSARGAASTGDEATGIVDEALGDFSPGPVGRALAPGRRPDRRRAPAGQARRRVLLVGRPGRPPVHPDELHREARRRACTLAHELGHAMQTSSRASGRPRSATTRRWPSPRWPRRSPS